MDKTLKSAILKNFVMTVLLGIALGAQGAGLGKLSVYSGIGQQLNAEVAVIATPSEVNSITAKLASHEAFREAGIEYMSHLSDVRIEVGKSVTGETVLKLRSSRPIDEPFLHFLIELNWTAGRVVREYTFLLDPPETLRVAKPASIVSPATRKEEIVPWPAAADPPSVNKQEPPSKLDTAVVSTNQPIPATGSEEYLVKRGDTLSKIARDHREDSVTLDQMLVALFNANTEAFIGDNMNRLRAGKVLRVPNVDEAGNISPSDARKVVVGHTAEFNTYRNRLAGAVASRLAHVSVPGRQEVSGTIKPEIESKSQVNRSDKLEVSRNEAAKSNVVGGVEDDLIAREKALREAADRIGMLEKNIENLKNLVEIKSQAGVQSQMGQNVSPPLAAPAAAAESPVASVAPVLPVAPVDTVKPVTPTVSPIPPTGQVDLPLSEPGFLDENPELLAGAGGVAALLLAYIGYSAWRRKKPKVSVEEDDGYPESAADEFIEPQPSRMGSHRHETDEMSIQGDFTDNGLLTSEAVVDPVAEADVLMAYGRDAQAEEILQDGISRDPFRSAIHLKLLDLYAKQGNVGKFETAAGKLHQLSQGRGADWDRAVGLAGILGLTGGLFGSGVSLAQRSETVRRSSVSESPKADEPLQTAAPVQSAEIPEQDVYSSLDFDLELGAPVKVEASADTLATTADDLSLDFDFDLGAGEINAAAEEDHSKPLLPTEIKLDEMDFDLDLGSPVELEGGDNSVDIKELSEVIAADSTSLKDLKLDFDLDLEGVPEINIVEDSPKQLARAAESENESLAFSAVELSTSLEKPTSEKGVTEDVVIEPDNPEVATKLELAQAYEEMGDLDGARELLSEVLSEGSKAQQAQAKNKLDQMSS